MPVQSTMVTKMENAKRRETTSAEKELDDLKLRLEKNRRILQQASKKSDSTELMSGVIKTIGTFEKR